MRGKKTFSEQQNPPHILEGEKKSCASSCQVFKGITVQVYALLLLWNGKFTMRKWSHSLLSFIQTLFLLVFNIISVSSSEKNFIGYRILLKNLENDIYLRLTQLFMLVLILQIIPVITVRKYCLYKE